MKIISRIALQHKDRILLVKNFENEYWSLPGGHWESDLESLKECAIRELKEETGIDGQVNDVLFSQEFTSKGEKVVEFIWKGRLSPHTSIDKKSIIDHTDTDPESEIETVQWFNISDIDEIILRPNSLTQYLKNPNIKRGHIES